jgi:hypothetical protein
VCKKVGLLILNISYCFDCNTLSPSSWTQFFAPTAFICYRWHNLNVGRPRAVIGDGWLSKAIQPKRHRNSLLRVRINGNIYPSLTLPSEAHICNHGRPSARMHEWYGRFTLFRISFGSTVFRLTKLPGCTELSVLSLRSGATFQRFF